MQPGLTATTPHIVNIAADELVPDLQALSPSLEFLGRLNEGVDVSGLNAAGIDAARIVGPVTQHAGFVRVDLLSTNREPGQAYLHTPYIGTVVNGRPVLYRADGVPQIRRVPISRTQDSALFEELAPRQTVQVPTFWSRFLPSVFKPKREQQDAKLIELGPWVPENDGQLRDALVKSALLLDKPDLSLVPDQALRDHLEFLALVNFMSANFVFPELDSHPLVTDRTQTEYEEDVNQILKGLQELDKNSLLTFETTHLAEALVSARWFAHIIDQFATESDDDILNMARVSEYFEHRWAPAVILSLKGGENNISALFGELENVADNYASWESQRGQHWGTAYEQILTEALILAKAHSPQDVITKIRLLTQLEKREDLKHAAKLAGQALSDHALADAFWYGSTTHTAADHKTMLHYFTARSRQQDYSPFLIP
ncbi:MAG: hypothetical protein H7A33_00775 [Deltaproteobacteria bacterium]|nr:hypothetical protein [Deltaproteobacteria bacterium]